MMRKKIFKTADGSPSLIIEELKETYHSRHGALTESAYVYIEKGLDYWIENNKKNKVDIFEMGMGTGLNAYLTYCYCKKNHIRLNYNTIEKYPLSIQEIQSLGMKNSLPHTELYHLFDWLHSSDWDKNLFTDYFSFHKSKGDFFDSTLEKKYDVLFYDAFGYHAQPKMWQEDALQICYQMLKPGGVWVSYCAKGSVRRILDSIGFDVERLAGPPGKREILRAVKTV
tara:strand:+ start:6188 stop:6865 length:678 start_codon:yes stop_codon:yes gene_type:complete